MNDKDDNAAAVVLGACYVFVPNGIALLSFSASPGLRAFIVFDLIFLASIVLLFWGIARRLSLAEKKKRIMLPLTTLASAVALIVTLAAYDPGMCQAGVLLLFMILPACVLFFCLLIASLIMNLETPNKPDAGDGL